jgi:IS605 OrfB family transposase
MIRTFETRIAEQDDQKAFVLDDLARRMCGAERKIYAFLASNREWKAVNYGHIYQKLGLSSSMFRSAKDSLDGKLASISELAKVQVVDIQTKIDQKQAEIEAEQEQLISDGKKMQATQDARQKLTDKVNQIKARLTGDVLKDTKRQKLLKQLKRLLNEIDVKIEQCSALRAALDAIPFSQHQHKRRLDILKLDLDRASARVKTPRICFGTKKLARKQNNLKINGFPSHSDWKKEWVDARNSTFQFVGVAKMEGGNEVAKLKLQKDNQFDLELRMPPAMGEKHGETICFTGLSFNHGHDAIVVALASRQALTVRFVRDEISWKIHVTIDQPTRTTRFNDDLGCLGVDFNADHVAATLVDRFGNPIRSWTIPMVTYGLSTEQATDLTRKVAKQVVLLAKQHNVPISAEDLDFARKKAQLSADSGPRYARMLSSLAYSVFQRALASACARNSIHLKLVNPAFTSLIGRTMFAHRYGLSVHAAAALSIARRAMKFSEKLPKPVEGKIILPFDDGDLVTLLRPVRIEGRHVWSSWRKLNTGYKAALAAHRLARRKSRSMELTPDGPNAGMASKGRVNDPLPVGFIQGVLG